MSYNRKAQLKIPYQDYLSFQSRQLIAQMTTETRQRLLEQVTARMVLNGEKPVNTEILNLLKGEINEQPI